MKCGQCDGCGKVANSDDGEPWTVWENLPPCSDIAVKMGIVKPISCPACGGMGEAYPDGGTDELGATYFAPEIKSEKRESMCDDTSKLGKAASDLATLALQSERYTSDEEFRKAVDDVFAATKTPST